MGHSNPKWSKYVQNLTLKMLIFKNQKTLVIYLDNQSTPKCMTFAPLWGLPNIFLNSYWTGALTALLLWLGRYLIEDSSPKTHTSTVVQLEDIDCRFHPNGNWSESKNLPKIVKLLIIYFVETHYFMQALYPNLLPTIIPTTFSNLTITTPTNYYYYYYYY